jgi:DNA-binding GntR family transcriptional regulator
MIRFLIWIGPTVSAALRRAKGTVLLGESESALGRCAENRHEHGQLSTIDRAFARETAYDSPQEDALIEDQLIHRPQLWEAVTDRLRAAILTGEIPAGTKLIEAALADRYGTSRGPIREAVRELARQGLIVELPRRGSVVATLTSHDLAEVYEVREALESGASKAAIRRATDAELRALEHVLEPMERAWEHGDWSLESVELDFAFHRALLALARNERMATTYEHMLTQNMHLLRTAAEANPTLRSGIPPRVHRDIIEALRARDEGRAGAAIDAHYRLAEERLFAQLADPA